MFNPAEKANLEVCEVNNLAIENDTVSNDTNNDEFGECL